PEASPWPIVGSHLSDEHNIPIGIINVATVGSWITQWAKSSHNLYPTLISTVNNATHGTMKVKALLWFQGEADCNPSEEYSSVSLNGDYNKYSSMLAQFVKDIHQDVKLDGIYVGIIGNVPHETGGKATSNRNNIFGIRKSLQDSWSEPGVVPGPVTYDID